MIDNIKSKFDSNDEYHSSNAISASGLKTISKYSVDYFVNEPRRETKAMALGTAVHTVLLEGQKEFERQYYMLPDIGDLRLNVNKAIKKEHLELAGDRKLLTFNEGQTIKGILENFQKDEVAKQYCTGIVEQSNYGDFNGTPVRVRPDCRGDNWIGDLKTCQDSSPSAFRKDLYYWGYNIQATFYCDALGIDPANFAFVAVSTKAPYKIGVYAMNEIQIERGRKAYQNALKDWEFYLETGIALGYTTEETTEDGRLIL